MSRSVSLVSTASASANGVSSFSSTTGGQSCAGVDGSVYTGDSEPLRSRSAMASDWERAFTSAGVMSDNIPSMCLRPRTNGPADFQGLGDSQASSMFQKVKSRTAMFDVEGHEEVAPLREDDEYFMQTGNE